DDTAKSFLCAGINNPVTGGPAFGTSFRGVSNCDPNFSLSELGTRTMWNPVPNLDVGVDLVWYHLNSAFKGTATLNANGAKPPGTYTVSDQDALAAIFRIQRNFIY